MTRHLVLDSRVTDDNRHEVKPGCAVTGFVRYDRSQHTYLTKLSTCDACLAAHAAWHAVFVASLKGAR